MNNRSIHTRQKFILYIRQISSPFLSYLFVHKCVLFVKLALFGSKLNLCI